MASVKIEIIGDSPEDMMWTLEQIALALGRRATVVALGGEDEQAVFTDKLSTVVEVEPKAKRGRKAKAEEAPAPAEEVPEEAPTLDGNALKEAALDAIKAVYDDKPIRAKFRPLLAEFDVTAFGDIKDADGARFHARVQEIIDQHHEDAA